MLTLRPYKENDAEYICSWIKDELTFKRWSADRFGSFPIAPSDINKYYASCAAGGSFFPFTLIDGEATVGHMTMRYPSDSRDIVRFGFVIVDDTKRGMGYGKKMITAALKYAFDILHTEKVTIGVFENNPSAYSCYIASGFNDTGAYETLTIMDESWRCLELEATNEKEVICNAEN